MEDSQTETHRPLLDEILLIIFGYLRLDDMKTCRLVCQQWNSCCEDRSVIDMKKYKYVFRSGVYSTTEINQILSNQSRHDLHVEFIGVRLNSLKFSEFGQNIRSLQITDCYFENIEPIACIFKAMQNLKHFDCHLAEEDQNTRKFLKKLTIHLRENSPVFGNLEKLECVHGETWDDYPRMDLPFQELYKLFPHLNTIRLPIINLNYLSNPDRGIKNDLMELYGANVEAGDKLSPQLQNLLITMPKLKKLDLRVESDWKNTTLDTCLALFSQQTELETVIFQLDCDVDEQCDHRLDEEADNETKKCPAKRIFFHILTNCKKLKTFHFFVKCEVKLRLNQAETRQFDKAIFTNSFTDLAIPAIIFQGDALASHLIALKNLKRLELIKNSSYFDSQNDPTQSSRFLCEEMIQILHSQKTLRTFKIKIDDEFYDDDTTSETDDSTRTLDTNVKRILDKLEYFEFSLRTWNSTIIQCTTSWKFTNLQTLNLTTPSEPWSLSSLLKIDFEAKDKVIQWIQSMSTLRHINLRWFRLNTEECIGICKQLPHLQDFKFESKNHPKKTEIRRLFANCQKLKDVTVWIVIKGAQYCEPAYYHANRSKNMLYIREIVSLGSIFYRSISSIN